MGCKLKYLSILLFFGSVCVSQCNSFVFTPDFYYVAFDFSKFSAESNPTFNGRATIYFDVAKKTYGVQEIKLAAENLIMFDDSYVIDLDRNKNITVINVNYVAKSNEYSISIKLDEAVSRIKVVISYQGSVGRVGDTGVYISDQLDVIGTNSYPLGARKIFPCILEPSVRTSFKFDFKLVNSSWGIHQLTAALESPFLPAHAVGFIMTYRYRLVEDISTDRFNVWVPSNDPRLYDSVNGNRALMTILKDDSYFGNYFGPAHLDKIHIVMVSGLKQLSIVNHRLIAIRPDFLVFSEQESAEKAKGSSVAMLNALSKHFFRCVISPDNWQDFWLADSLALYFQYALLNNTFKDPYFPEMFMIDVQRPAMRGSALDVDPKIIDPLILTTDQIYPPVYQGAAVLKMLEVLSSQDEVLNDFFKYFKTYKYSNVKTRDLLNFMNNGSFYQRLNAYGKTLEPILDNWLHKTGYPFITGVTIGPQGFTIAQEQFLGSEHDSVSWIFPFEYRDSFEIGGKLSWFSGGKSEQVTDGALGSWLVLNKQSKGLFRVDYGQALGPLLRDDVYWRLHGSERGALVDDAFELAINQIAGIDLGNALVLIDYLAGETDYVPFSLAVNHMNSLWHFLDQKGLGNEFKQKMAEILVQTYSKVSWNKVEPVSFGKTVWTRSVVEAACRYQVYSCLNQAASAPVTKILGDLIPTVNCEKVRNKPHMWKNFFADLYHKNDSQYTRADALYALACPQSLEQESSPITEYLNTINSDAILEEDALRAFQYIYSKPDLMKQTFNYICTNFSLLSNRFKDDFMSSLISDISKLLLPEYYSAELSKLEGKVLKTSKTYAAIAEAQIEMKRREQFMDINLNQLKHWIQTNSTTFRPLPPPTTTQPPSNSNHSNTDNSAVSSQHGLFTIIFTVFTTLLFSLN